MASRLRCMVALLLLTSFWSSCNAHNTIETHNATATLSSLVTAEWRRRLATAPGNVATCYTPFHNPAYPLFGGPVDINVLRDAIDADFSFMSKYFTHVRTFYSMHYGIEVAPIAKKYGIKLYLGMFLTLESWQADEMRATVNAIKYHSDTVEVVLVGSENLAGWQHRSGDILAKVNQVKQMAGADAWRVKYGTVQRITEYLDPAFSSEMQNLNANLDILGVNIYPFFNNQYNSARPTDLLDAQWNAVLNRFPAQKIRLTEIGFPTGGSPSSIANKIWPSLDGSINYYNAVVNWRPTGATEGQPKFWFQAFDRRAGDRAIHSDYEMYFGFFRADRSVKGTNYPQSLTGGTVPSGAVGSPARCGMESGVDYIGNDFMNRPSTTAAACITICRRQVGCNAFSWTNYMGGTCWLKTRRDQTISRANVQSGVPCPCMETGVDYMALDIGSAPSSTPEGCQPICQRTAKCGAFSWTTFQGGMCWLKSGRQDAFSRPGVTSGVVCPS